MKKILLVVFTAIVLVGCGGKKKETICTSKLDEGVETIYTIESKGDKASSIETKFIIDLSVDSSYEDKAKELDESIKEQSEGVKGIEHSSEVKDDKYYITVKVDYTEADLDELLKMGLVTSEDGKSVKYISLEATVKGLEADDAICKSK